MRSDYIGREGRYEQNREELEHKEHGNMPEWAEDDPEKYWEAADEHERANGRLYSEVQFALPKELNEDERREAASSFAERLTGGERLPYTLAIHRGGTNGENPHAHLMFSERGNDGIERSGEQWFKRHNAKAPEKGGARKSRPATEPGRLGRRRGPVARASEVRPLVVSCLITSLSAFQKRCVDSCEKLFGPLGCTIGQVNHLLPTVETTQ